MKKIVIGIDQSYNNSGISIAVDNELKSVTSLWLNKAQDNTEKRNMLIRKLTDVFNKMSLKRDSEGCKLICIVERIRLSSQGFVNINYIKSIGALNACIVDTAKKYGIEVYSVDTRSWKSQVVGSSKPMVNKYGIDKEKWPTILWLIKKGFEDKILVQVTKQKKKGVIVKDGIRYTYNDDAADSAGIALYGFVSKDKQLLQEEH